MIVGNKTDRIEVKPDDDIFCSWFIERVNTDNDNMLIEKILDHPECDCFIVYLKYKYEYEEEYVYTAQPCDITWVCKHKYASDNNIFLIELFKHLDEIEQLPNEISKEHYVQIRNEYNYYKQGFYDELKHPLWYIGAVGFLASYNGRFFDGGYSGTRIVKNGVVRNYYKEAKDNLLKQRKDLKNIHFDCCDYRNVNPKSSVVYCDIPYFNTKQYSTSRNFNHDDFYKWCRGKSKNNIILLSEQEAPSDFKCIWEQENTRTLNHNNHIKRVEKLFVLE